MLAARAQQVTVFTDCLLLGSAFRSSDLRDKAVHLATKRIASALGKLEAKSIDISMRWFRGRVGIDGNERAHEIARLPVIHGIPVDSAWLAQNLEVIHHGDNEQATPEGNASRTFTNGIRH